MTVSLEERMQRVLDRLNIPLRVAYLPGDKSKVHGEIVEGSLYIFDEDESQAWETFLHEVLEHKLKSVTRAYRLTVNSLIEVIQKMCYSEKEVFLESVPLIVETVQKARGEA